MFKKVLDAIHLVLTVICGFSMAVIVTVLFYAVIMRYVFHRPPSWSMELSRYLFIWMVMLSAVLVTREQSHIQITFILDLLPNRLRFLWVNTVRLLMVGFCWVMIYQGVVIYPIVSEAFSPSLGISMGWLYLSIPAGGLLMGIYILESIARSIMDQAKGEGSRE